MDRIVFSLVGLSASFAALALLIRYLQPILAALGEMIAYLRRPEDWLASLIRELATPIVLGRDESRQFGARLLARQPDSHARAPLSCAFVAAG